LVVAERIVEPDGSGRLTPERVATGNRHTFVVRRLVLDHRYHDEDPVQGADFTVSFPNGLVVSGKLDAEGKATLVGVPARGEVRYGPDHRPFERVDSGPNPDHRGPLAEDDFDTLRAKHGG
jgi:type VI secretion system secreted protein VgrG